MDNSSISSGIGDGAMTSNVSEGSVSVESTFETEGQIDGGQENIGNQENVFEAPEIHEEVEDRIMDIPGTAHDKLSGLAEMTDEEIEEPIEDGEAEETASPEFDQKNELSFEQELLKIQADTMKLMAEAMNSSLNEAERKKILEEIKKLMEKMNKSDDENKGSLMAGLLGVVLLLMNMTEKGYKAMENEVKQSTDSN